MRASPSRTPAQTHTSTRARHAIVRDLHASNPHMACRDSLRGTSRTERLELISVLRNHEMRVGLWLGQRSAKHMHRLDGNASRSASRAQSWQLQPRWTTSNEQRATCNVHILACVVADVLLCTCSSQHDKARSSHSCHTLLPSNESRRAALSKAIESCIHHMPKAEAAVKRGNVKKLDVAC